MQYKRIISLNSALTEALYILKAENNLIGCTFFCKEPKNNPKIIKLASTFSANLEEILHLNPDLILTSGLTSKKILKTLGKLNIKVVSFNQPKNFEEICDQFLEIGKYVGKELLAKKNVEEFTLKVQKLTKECQKFPQNKVFFQIGKKPLFTAHEDSYVNDLLVKTNCINIGNSSVVGYFNLEEVITRNPDIILYVSMIGNNNEEADFWKGFKNLKAVKNNAIYKMDTYEICSAIPESFYKSMETISNYINQTKSKPR